MGKVVTLLKPFVYSKPARPGSRLPTETHFHPRKGENQTWLPTEVEIPDEIHADPWVSEDFADGAIESPEVAERRKAAVAAKVAKDAEANERIRKQAEQAMNRARGNAGVRKVNKEQLEKDLNTPVNELGAARGADIDPTAAESEKPAEAVVAPEAAAPEAAT